nr:hypothetical protein [Tanacetum cinerariifolium]
MVFMAQIEKVLSDLEASSSTDEKIFEYFINHHPLIIQQDLNLKLISDELMIEQRNELFKAMQSMFEEYHQREQVANLSIHTPGLSRRYNSICYDDDDDDEDRTIPLRSKDSLIMGNEDLNTIPEKESDKVINSSVEDLVLIPSESEDTPGIDSEYILPFDDESLSDKDVLKDNVEIYSNPLLEFDDEYISSDVNPLFDEVLEDIECKDSYDSNLDESTLLVTHLSDSNEDEYLAPGDDVELLLHRDPSIPKMSIASILKRFIDEPPLEENDDFFDLESKKNDWKKILYDALIDDLMTEDKVFDPVIHDQIFSLTYVKMDDPNITMKEYIRIKEEKACRHGKVYNWETVKYGKIWYDEDVHDHRYVKTEFPTIVFDNALTSKVTPSYGPTVNYSNDLDFFKDFENEFPTIVYNDALTSKSYFLTEHIVSPQCIDEFNNETSLTEFDEKEQNVLYFNDLFPLNVIYPNDLKLDTDNDNDKIDIEQPSGDMNNMAYPRVWDMAY